MRTGLNLVAKSQERALNSELQVAPENCHVLSQCPPAPQKKKKVRCVCPGSRHLEAAEAAGQFCRCQIGRKVPPSRAAGAEQRIQCPHQRYGAHAVPLTINPAPCTSEPQKC